MITASEDGTARIWDAHTGRALAILKGHAGSVRCAKFDATGRKIVTASTDGSARLWDTQSGEELAVLSGHEDTVWAAEFSPDGTYVATASQDFSVCLWDAETGRQIAVPWRPPRDMKSAAFSPDEKRVVTASVDGAVRVWDASNGREMLKLNVVDREPIKAWFNENGTQVLALSQAVNAEINAYSGIVSPPTLGVWSAETGEPLTVSDDEFRALEERALADAVSRDGRRLVVASRGAHAILVDRNTDQSVQLVGHTEPIESQLSAWMDDSWSQHREITLLAYGMAPLESRYGF